MWFRPYNTIYNTHIYISRDPRHESLARARLRPGHVSPHAPIYYIPYTYIRYTYTAYTHPRQQERAALTLNISRAAPEKEPEPELIAGSRTHRAHDAKYVVCTQCAPEKKKLAATMPHCGPTHTDATTALEYRPLPRPGRVRGANRVRCPLTTGGAGAAGGPAPVPEESRQRLVVRVS